MSVDRRQFVKGTVIAVGSAVPLAFGVTGLVRGQGESAAPAPPAEAMEGLSGQPPVFDSPEMLAVAAIAARIVPTTDQPGAAEVGVVPYINDQIYGQEELLAVYREGVASLTRASQARSGKPFHQLDEQSQRELLKGIEKSKFFTTIRRHTIEAFYNSPIGVYVASGYKGGRSHIFCDHGGMPDVDQKPKV